MQNKFFISIGIFAFLKKIILLVSVCLLPIFSSGCKSNKGISKEAKMQLDSDQQNFRKTFNEEIK